MDPDTIVNNNSASETQSPVLPKKWNAIVSKGQDQFPPTNVPEPQPLPRRERSESLPVLEGQFSNAWSRSTLSSLFEDDSPNPKTEEDLSSSLYKAIWRTIDGSMATSPVRSPVVADWKVVGSPSGSSQKLIDPLEQMLEDEIRLRDGSGSLSGFSSVDRTRRMRSASVIGELLHSGSAADLFNSSAGSPVNNPSEEENRNGGESGQVAHLPLMLHEELGVENDAEATEIFKRSSMESILDDLVEGTDSISRSTDYFKNITFGPLGQSVFTGTASASAVINSPGNLDRRRPSYLGLTDWPFSAGAIGTKSDHFVEDDYFAPLSPWSIPIQQRITRRHSLVSTDNAMEEQFSHLGFGSAPKSSPPKHPHGFGYGGDGGNYGENDYLPVDDSPPFQLSSYNGPLWAVEFKSGRTEIFYVIEVDSVPQVKCSVGDLVIVEADRGEDLGRITAEISVSSMRSCISDSTNDDDKNEISSELAALLRSKEIVPKRIHRLAQAGDLKLLQAKAQEEALAMVRCQSRIRQKKLPMEVVDAEYQWDRNKLTFYFIADRRIDFRELVRDLFRIYKTRIWMCAVDKTSPRMINYLGGLVPVHNTDGDVEEKAI